MPYYTISDIVTSSSESSSSSAVSSSSNLNSDIVHKIVKLNSDALISVLSIGNPKNDVMLFENPWYSKNLKVSSLNQLAIEQTILVQNVEINDSLSSVFEDRIAFQRLNILNKNDQSTVNLNHTSWNEHFEGTKTLDSNYRALIFKKCAIYLDTQEDFPSVFDFIHANAKVFILDLKRGSIADFHKIFGHLRLTKNFLSHAIDVPIHFSTITNISERLPKTGFFRKKYSNIIELKYGNQIIVTCDRNYAEKGSKNVVYVNCLGYMKKLNNCDLIEIGKIHLRVIKQINISALCEVVRSGILMEQVYVTFPQSCLLELNELTPEEIDDINYTKDELINCIILPTFDCNIYFNSIQNYLKSIDFQYCRIFATVYSNNINDMNLNDIKLIAKTYDGLQLNIYNNEKYRKDILKLTTKTKYLIEQFYLYKKPILLGKFFLMKTVSDQNIIIDSDSEKYIYYYPDKYILDVDEKKLSYMQTYTNIQKYRRLIMHEYALEYMTNIKLNELNSSENDLFAKTISKASYDYVVNCIILASTKSGRMAIKIAHYRPNCPIIVLCNNVNILRYLNIYHNILVAFYNTKYKINPQILNLKKLWYGLIYAVSLNVVQLEENIMFIYEINSTKKIALFRLTSKLYDKLIEN